MNRTAQYGARSRGQTANYLPEDLTIVGDEKFAAWVTEKFGKHGPKVLVDAAHPLYDPRVQLVFDPEWYAKLEVLARDILENKVEVPIGITIGEIKKGQPQVLDVYGRRRIIATALAIQIQLEQGVKNPEDWIHLPAVIRRGTMEELRLVMLAENDNREGNPPSVQAENVYRAVVLREQPIQKVANRMGQTVLYLERLLKMRECEQVVIRGVDSGVIHMQAIDEFRKLPPQKQIEQAERMMSADPKSGRSAAAQIRDENPDHAAPAGAPPAETASEGASDPPAAPPPKPRPRKEVAEELAELEKALANPKMDAHRRLLQARLDALRWALRLSDERPSEVRLAQPRAGAEPRA